MSTSSDIAMATTLVTKEKGMPIRIEGIVVGVVVMILDTINAVTGILYSVLPESRGAVEAPDRFVDTGLGDLLAKMENVGFSKSNAIVKIIGGSGFASDPFNIGRRNIEKAKGILGQHGFFVRGVDIGGRVRRDVEIVSGEPRVKVTRLNNVTLDREVVTV